MNYYITYCDEKYLQHAEKLFSLLEIYSKYKIIVFTINFEYKNQFKNVIPIYYETKEPSYTKNLFIKPHICKILLDLYSDGIFCYLDADIIPLKNCDDIFNDKIKLNNYPLIARQCHDFIFLQDNEIDKNFESNLLQFLNPQIKERTTLYYRQTCIFLFNNNCLDFIHEWSKICKNKIILENHKKYAPIHDETVANCLLWINKYDDYLGRIHIDLPNFNKKNILEFLYFITNPTSEDVLYDSFTRIPSNEEIRNIKFFHGKIDSIKFDLIKSFNNYHFNNIL